MTERFDPNKHLRVLKGKGGSADYLDVKWRLVWLRSEHPDAVSTVEHVEISPDIAIFKASVSIPGKGSATDYGSETPRDFGDYIEKAATKALGRALAQLGYGTQFVGFELDENTRIVDSPVNRRTEDDDGHAASQPARQNTANPPPAFVGRPRETPAAVPPAATAHIEKDLLAAIHDGARDPDARWDALWDYYDRAGDVADLNRRAERVKASGIPERDLRAAYKQKHSALAQLLGLAGGAQIA